MAAEDVRDFTRWLTYLTFVQAFIGFAGLWVTLGAARAAKHSADTAADMLRVSSAAHLELKGHYVREHFDSLGHIRSLTAAYRIANISGNLARDVHVRADYGAGHTRNQSIEQRLDRLSPSKGFDFRMNIGMLSPEHQAQFGKRELFVQTAITVTWKNPINDQPDSVTFHRILNQNESGDWESQILRISNDPE